MAILNDQAQEVIRKSGEWLDPLKDSYLKVGIADNGSLDSFGRLRVSSPIEIFGNKNIYSENADIWYKLEAGAGAVSYITQESAVGLTVGTASGDRAVRQSRSCPYIPGKSQLINITGVFGDTPTENNVRRVGLFDDENGIFLEQNGSDVYFVIRSDTSGSVVEDKVIQSSWNVNTYDDLDLSQCQILAFSFQWLGVGKVKCHFVQPNGELFLCHVFEHTNTTTKVYMRNPTLPVRFENVNIDTTANSTTLKEICCSVSSEGGSFRAGYSFEVGVPPRAIVLSTETPIAAIRLKSSFNSKQNRVSFQILAGGVFAEDAVTLFRLYRVSTPNSITGTWVDVDTGHSGSEYSTDITAYTGADSTLLKTAYLTASASGSKVQSESSNIVSNTISEHAFLSQNVDSTNSSMYVITAYTTDAPTNVGCSINWIEYH